MRLPQLGPVLLCACVLVFFSCGDPGSGGGGGGTAGTGGGTAAGGGSGTGGSSGGGSATGGGTGTGGSSTGGGTAAGGGSATGGGTQTGSINIIVEPSDDAAALRAAITNATTSVHMTMYLLSNNSIISALIAQHQAGHEVQVLLNQTFPNGAGSNSSVFAQLQSAGVQVRWAPSTFTLTHEKCVIIDGTTAWIMTMNATGSSPTDNREYLAVDTKPAEVAEAEAIFQADWANTSLTPSGTLIVAPTNAGARIPALIDQANTYVDMEGEELSDTGTVMSLVAAKNRGATVHIVLADTTPTTAQMMAITQLKTAGVNLVTLHSPYIHAKAIVVDGKNGYVGSENFTAGSLYHNRELGVFVTDTTQLMKIKTTTDTDFSNGTAL
jgi:phosphatidylserine/phosphatidylglycerophosphate/cardiolipin synthase-like enzyme